VSPSGTRCVTAKPQELQNLIKELADTFETCGGVFRAVRHGNISP
jgi:hypothetical protein